MISRIPMDTPEDVDRFASLEQRVSNLEMQIHSPNTWREWLRGLLRWLAATPPLVLLLLVGMDRLSSSTALPLGLLVLVLWGAAAVLWAAIEVLTGGNLRFRLTRLLLIVAIFAVILGYWQVTVQQPYRAELRCLTSLKGLDPDVRRKPVGPDWLIGLVGKDPFQRVHSIGLVGPEADPRQIRTLHALPHLDSLWLTGPVFDERIIDDLAALPTIKMLVLQQSRVTKSGVERLRRVRPDLEVFLQ